MTFTHLEGGLLAKKGDGGKNSWEEKKRKTTIRSADNIVEGRNYHQIKGEAKDKKILADVQLSLICLCLILGNVFVIAAILLERNLQNVANYLILSLAVADLLVACLVMPLGAVYEVSKQWTLGPELCDMWTSSDVLCCTASILHLVAIALDRYWAVTNIDYIHQRTAKRIGCMIFIVWAVAFLVCIAPMFGWKDEGWEARVTHDRECLVSQDIGYQIFATASSFYLPLAVILILYWRIFQTARKRIRRRVTASAGTSGGVPTPRNPASGGVIAGAAGSTGGIVAAVVTVIGRPLPTISETTTAFTTVSSTNTSPEKGSFANGLEPDAPTVTDCNINPYPHHQQTQHFPTKRKPKDSADSKRERKAAKTLAIITGAFVICWLPFFIMAILLPICNSYAFNEHMIAFFLWLGYFNSTLNPIIYTIFSPEFRHAFKRILCGRRSIRRRNRHFGVRYLQ
ncbi:5-hydroxytryptamine receptor-like [Anabrus simplex]|uniref:5-hydroxytryptamine receptor-like n=1 Tax=Anabrus simplex TaxID=316456 RepID=UPI0035A282D0